MNGLKFGEMEKDVMSALDYSIVKICVSFDGQYIIRTHIADVISSDINMFIYKTNVAIDYYVQSFDGRHSYLLGNEIFNLFSDELMNELAKIFRGKTSIEQIFIAEIIKAYHFICDIVNEIRNEKSLLSNKLFSLCNEKSSLHDEKISQIIASRKPILRVKPAN